jgi:hypothetical protein
MRRTVTALCLMLFVGCATYRDDLDRAMVHYHSNEYDKALALLEVLEDDIDSLSPSERAHYSYYRGLSHYRLDQRHDARHWLGMAAARNKARAGSLTAEEKKRVDDTLAELNEARWGGAKTGEAESKDDKEKASEKATDKPTETPKEEPTENPSAP